MNHNRFSLMTDSQENKNESLWEYGDVAAYLRVSEKTVERWAKTRKLPVLKIGGLNRFDPEAIREWARSRAA